MAIGNTRRRCCCCCTILNVVCVCVCVFPLVIYIYTCALSTPTFPKENQPLSNLDRSVGGRPQIHGTASP
jgi:hypothetical protein